MRSLLIKFTFSALLFLGVIGFYLLFYGAFRISFIGFAIAVIVSGGILYLDLLFGGCTRDKYGRRAVSNVLVCVVLYLSLSGWVLVRAGHEMIGELQVHTGSFSQRVKGSYRWRLCRYSISVIEPVEFLGSKLCLSYEDFLDFRKSSKVIRWTNLRRAIFVLETSLLGKTIFLPVKD